MYNLIINIKVNENLFNKDPQSSTLGKRILEHSVLMIDEIGLELFTFKKLAKEIKSTEASIYRYFENKHQLFVYLLNWYWEWLIARIELNTLNIADASTRLRIVIRVIVDAANRNSEVEFVDEEALHRIVVQEGAKGYHHKAVDADNEEGFFLAFKRLVGNIAGIIAEINPEFSYPRTLASTMIETANNNLYYAQHLPRLTDINTEGTEENLSDKVKKMIEVFCFGLIDCNDKISDK
ncbi:MAG: AcrR family transcriptional regulator [Saprospiraceae bacterium]|jgi:AcrR family transcriptional regulator